MLSSFFYRTRMLARTRYTLIFHFITKTLGYFFIHVEREISYRRKMTSHCTIHSQGRVLRFNVHTLIIQCEKSATFFYTITTRICVLEFIKLLTLISSFSPLYIIIFLTGRYNFQIIHLTSRKIIYKEKIIFLAKHFHSFEISFLV